MISTLLYIKHVAQLPLTKNLDHDLGTLFGGILFMYKSGVSLVHLKGAKFSTMDRAYSSSGQL